MPCCGRSLYVAPAAVPALDDGLQRMPVSMSRSSQMQEQQSVEIV
jgi:hypothetical protein